MKCERCKAFRSASYEYGEYECYAGVPEDEIYEDDKGNYGCRNHWKTIQKLINQHDSCYEISIADGQRMVNPEAYEKRLEKMNADKRYVEQAKHCIGLDYLRHKPYKRNGKLYFRPYRNHYYTKYHDEIWDNLRWLGFADCDTPYWQADKTKRVQFSLNDDGLAWLAGKCGIYKIWRDE